MPVSVGDKFAPYEVLTPIGAGGMGELWRARDMRLNREVAIKFSQAEFSDRFQREANAIASLNHPNICTLFDVGPSYLVMELIEGPTLAIRIKEEPIPLEETLGTARQIADALDAAHEKGIVHRDLKPGNIKIRQDGPVKVLDFGLAKTALAETTVAHDSPTLMHSPTTVGVILGTAAYMAPEQARGKTVDKRTDICVRRRAVRNADGQTIIRRRRPDGDVGIGGEGRAESDVSSGKGPAAPGSAKRFV